MKTTFEIDSGLVYKVDDYEDGTFARSVYCAEKKLVVEGGNSINVGTILPLTVKLFDYKGNVIAEEHAIQVTVKGEEIDQVIEINMVGGIAEFDFQSDMPGKYSITATAVGITHDPGRCEVTVNG